MKMILVNKAILRDLVEEYREGFNDCACCPLYLNCEHAHDMGPDCDDDIMRFLQSGKDYGEDYF